MLCLLFPSLNLRGDTQFDSVGVNLQVSAINELAVTGSSPTLVLSSATPGTTYFSASSTAVTYAYTSNDGSTKKIMGRVDTAMPSNTFLYASLEAPSGGGTSLGEVSLTTSDTNLVTSITANTKDTDLDITYKFEADVNAGVLSEFSRIITFTLTNN